MIEESFGEILVVITYGLVSLYSRNNTLGYITAIYPLVLVVITCGLVSLYSRNNTLDYISAIYPLVHMACDLDQSTAHLVIKNVMLQQGML